MRCVVIQTAYLGDVILTVPLLALLRRDERISQVAIVASPPGSGFIAEQGAADAVIEYDKRGRDSGPLGFLRVVGRIREFGPDAAFIPHRSFRSALIPALAGVRARIGFDVSGGRFLLTDRRPYPVGVHEAERVASLAEALEIDVGSGPRGVRRGELLPFELRVPDGAEDALARALAARGTELSGTYVLVAPGSRWATKRWLPRRFAEAGATVSREIGGHVVVTGAPFDTEVSAEVAGALGDLAVDLTGDLSICGLTALVGGASIVLSNDSAVSHIAAGLGVPVVVVFGPTVPEQGFAPYSRRARVVQAELSCRPCGKHGSQACNTGSLDCMEKVGAEEVAATARELLAAGGADG